MTQIDEIIQTFQSVDQQTRLEVLLDYANKLPALPPDLAREAEADDGARVPECMTPVWMWILPENGKASVHVRVAEEAPTVKGVLSVIVHGYTGAAPEELASVPQDLIAKLGLSQVVRMNRAVGINAILERIRRRASDLTSQGSTR